MANLPGIRIRGNNVFGAVSDNPLATGSITFNSPNLADLPTVAGNHAIITLDPLRQYGFPEIVMVTAHTASATVATIQRGMYGTTARTHPQNTFWAHAAVEDDFLEVDTTATRPTDNYQGQLIFDTDRNAYVGRATSQVWQEVMQLGAWDLWSPTLVGLTGGTNTVRQWTRMGRTIYYRFKYVLAGAGFATNPSFTLPVPPAADYVGQDIPIGHAAFADNGTATFPGVVIHSGASVAQFQAFNAAGTYALGNAPTASVPFTWAINDYVYAWGTYEAAT